MCDGCRVVKRKGRLYVVCDKVPKHKQRQGVFTATPAGLTASHTSDTSGVAWHETTTAGILGGWGAGGTSWSTAGIMACCDGGAACRGQAHRGVSEGTGGVAGLVFSGNYRTHAASSSLLPRIARATPF